MSATKLLIVESPSKAKTIKKYLGSTFIVKASVGHIRDLPAKRFGINIEQNFEPTYQTIAGKNELIKDLKKTAKEVDEIFIATDPDREGEAIAFHLYEILNKLNKNIHRVLFNEITKKAVKTAIKNYTTLDMNKVNAQQTRRILDRIVGYKLSPLLWKKILKGLSAGRVQSVATKIIVDRENEIKAFIPIEYWNIKALFNKDNMDFNAQLFSIDDKKLDPKGFHIENEKEADKILKSLKKQFDITKVETKERKQEPLPPYITSKLQQDAATKLGFSSKKTMLIAQKLYEGIDVGGSYGITGLITYMRTDSYRISDDANKELRIFIENDYGKTLLNTETRTFATKKTAQDAHEAIRPTVAELTPDKIKGYLDDDELRLYQLIWKRFVATQMIPAVFDKTTVEITNGNCLFKTTGEVLKEKGFLILDSKIEIEDSTLPELKTGEKLKAKDVTKEQKFTQPPLRYTEATLIKKLEEEGIGRPSTYATIVTTIQDRSYVLKEENKFKPTEIGIKVTEQLINYFQNIINIEFSSKLETELDLIEEGNKDFLEVLKNFYTQFESDLENANKTMPKLKPEDEKTEIVCEKCSGMMVVKTSKSGKFLACSNYPTCKNIKKFSYDENKNIIVEEQQIVYADFQCPTCAKKMILARGKFGTYYKCEDYPTCKTTMPFTLNITCPKCEDGKIVEKRTKTKKIFYSCSNYPKCDFVSWYKPVNKKCPECGSLFLVEKYSKKKGNILKCPNKTCSYEEAKD